jgi:hypothetical protein
VNWHEQVFAELRGVYDQVFTSRTPPPPQPVLRNAVHQIRGDGLAKWIKLDDFVEGRTTSVRPSLFRISATVAIIIVVSVVAGSVMTRVHHPSSYKLDVSGSSVVIQLQEKPPTNAAIAVDVDDFVVRDVLLSVHGPNGLVELSGRKDGSVYLFPVPSGFVDHRTVFGTVAITLTNGTSVSREFSLR